MNLLLPSLPIVVMLPAIVVAVVQPVVCKVLLGPVLFLGQHIEYDSSCCHVLLSFYPTCDPDKKIAAAARPVITTTSTTTSEAEASGARTV